MQAGRKKRRCVHSTNFEISTLRYSNKTTKTISAYTNINNNMSDFQVKLSPQQIQSSLQTQLESAQVTDASTPRRIIENAVNNSETTSQPNCDYCKVYATPQILLFSPSNEKSHLNHSIEKCPFRMFSDLCM